MSNTAQQIPLDLVSRPALGREDFLIGACNQSAVSWIDSWPDWPAPVLILCGPAASGKTHLAAVWRERAGAENIRPEMLLSRSAEQIAAVSSGLIFDGIDLWLGDIEAETTLFHLYNIFKEEGRTLLITTRMSPSEADFAIPDLASRLRAAPAAEIRPPDDAVLAAVLIKLFHDRQIAVNDDLIKYILPRMERSFAAAHELVERADKMALAQKRGISIPLMRLVMADMQDV